jgi:DNA-binding GntR family transcriptional regulator
MIGKRDRAERSFEEHLAIIRALEKRETEAAVRLSRDHTLGLAALVEELGSDLFQ